MPVNLTVNVRRIYNSVLLNSVKFDILTRFHEALSHLGRDKMLAALKDYYFYCGVTKVVDKVIHESAICQSFKGNARGGELYSITDKPRECVSGIHLS